MCSSGKNPYAPHGRSLEIPRGRGVLKVKKLEAKYEAEMEFPAGEGCKTKTFHGGYGYFLELHSDFQMLILLLFFISILFLHLL